MKNNKKIDKIFPKSESQLEKNKNNNSNLMSDYDLMRHIKDEGMEDMIIIDGEGGLVNREEIITILQDSVNNF